MPSFFFVNGGQSIQSVINSASAGDTIMVGTGVFNEHLLVNKQLNIISLDGAGTTIINGAVSITASGVDFGDTHHGFTINAGATDTAAISLGAVSDIHIEGNTLNGNAAAAASLTTRDLFGSGGESNVTIENNVFLGTADELLRINGEANGAADSHNIQLLDNTFSGTTTAGGSLVVLDADGSSVSNNTFSGGTASTALALQQPGDSVAANNNFSSFGTGTDIATVDSFDLQTVTGAENLTLLDGAANTQTFDDLGLGPITDGENGWTVNGPNAPRDQAIVDLAGNHVFRMSSDPSVADFAGPYSPKLNVAAGESTTSAAFRGQSIAFDFSAVNPIPDGSRLEIDFGNAAGTDRNNFLVLESFAGTGIRIAVSEPNLAGDFSGNNAAPAPNDWRELVSHVDPTQQHHLEMRLNYLDGANNDKIDVYLDGALIGTTTTFENYHDALGGTHAANAEANLTDRVFFRPSANGSPQDGAGGAANAGFNIDNVTTAVYNDTNGTGTNSDNIINGNSGNNIFSGLGGNDTLNGGGGNDTLIGGAGNDTINGGAGFDTAVFSGNQGDYNGSFDGVTVTLVDTRLGSPDGTDTITGVGRAHFADHDVLLVTPGGDFATIQAAINAANPGDTIVIGPGTYHENITINKANLTLTGSGPGVVIAGTFRTDNGITGSTADFFKTAASYSTASGNGVTITADHTTLQNLKISGFNTDIELGDGVDHTRLEGVTLSDAVNGIRKATFADLTDLNIIGGKISEVYLGINFAKSATAGDGLVTGMTVDGTTFEHITQKGIYTETLSQGLITNITMNDVGQYGGGPAFGANGTNGNGIDINLKYEVGVYNDITIQNFTFTNVGLSNGLGSSHANAAAIAVKARDDAPSYAPIPADFTGSVIIQNGTIDGTSTGIRAGEAGKNIADPAIDITNVAITNAVHSATHGDVANVTQSTETVTMTSAAETLIASPSSTGPIVIHAGGGDDKITAGNGNDTIEGGSGNDALHGVGGTDTALYSGLITAANVTPIADADLTTPGNQPGWQVNAGAEGTDTLDDIEIIDNSGHNILLVGNGGFATIQSAIDAASAGDTIMVAAGTYTENVNFNKAVTVFGAKHGTSGTGAGRDAAAGLGEATIIGRSDITASGAVTIDGFRFLNDATTTGGGPGDPTLQIQNGNDHVVTNSIFYSTVLGGVRPSPDDRAIALPVIATGHVTISDNDFTGSHPGLFGDASWGREVWFDGGGVNLTVTGNTFQFGRTALNLDISGTSDVTVQNNTFKSDGTALAVGFDTAHLHVIDNNVENVGDDFNLRNLTVDTTFDADTAINIVTPANPGNDAVVILGGAGNDTFFGTAGVDFIDGNDLNAAATDHDVLHGRGGADFLFGNGGNDTLDGGTGDDTLNGGAGIDTATYAGTLTAASFSYDSANHRWVVNAGAEGTDTLTGVEVVTDGSGHQFRLVDGSGTSGYAHIQDAIDAAAAGDVILIAPGSYTESGSDGIGHTVGLYINKANLTLAGYSSLDGSLITSADEAKLHGPTVISGHQTGFGANHWVDAGGDNVTIEGLHLQAGPETDNKLLEIWADNVTVKNNFIDVNLGGTTYTFAAAIYLNDNGTTSSEISSYTIDHNILNEGIIVSNGVGDPPGIGANELITNNKFEGTFDYGSGEGRYDTVVVNGQVPGIGWLLAPSEFPTVSGNTFANNTTPFLFRGSDSDAANFPTAAQVAQILAADGDNNLSYAYVLDSLGNLRVADRDDGSGPYHSFAVTNTLDTLNLSLDNTADAVFGGHRTYMQVGDTVVVQSGDGGPANSAVMVENLTIKATQHSADLNLTLATQLADGTPIPGGVVQVTLADYAAGLGANVDVAGNGLDNIITGNSGNNVLSGLGGNDTFRPNGGNDTVDGGANTDTVIYAGPRAAYQVDDLGGGQIRVIDLRPGSPDGTDTVQNVENFTFSDGTFAAAAVLNDPVTGTVTIAGSATEDQVLTANNTLADADGLGALHYQWKRDGANAGTDQSAYTLGDADVGKSISVVVSYTDGHGTLESVTSGNTVGPVANVNDAPTGAVTIDGTITEDQTLTANTATLADADGLGTLHYQWKRDGANAGTDQATYALGDADVGKSISVAVSYTDGHGTAESVTSGSVGPVANVNDAPTGTVTITGTATEDQTLGVSSTLADADGLGALHYQWKRDGANAGTDQATYTLGDGDVGKSITVVVSYTDGHGTAESVTSAPTSAVANVNDAPVAQDDATSGAWNLPLEGDVLATDVDLPAQSLAYSLVGVNGGAQHGSVSLGSDGHYSYTPNVNFHGADSFHFHANDGIADSNSATIDLTILQIGAGSPPIVHDDAASVNEYQTVTGNVITGVPGGGADTDPGTGTLHVTGIAGGTVETALAGTLGSLTIHDDGSYSYVANNAESLYSGISGADTFTYTVTGTGGDSNATLTITVNGVNSGTPGDDHVIGGPTGEVLDGGAGNDIINGNGGDDTIFAGDGNDTVSGGDGNDIIVGQGGDDFIKGDAGEDKINAGDGNDTMMGGAGNDELGGGIGNDIIVGGDGNDTIFGEDGNDQANGGNGNDILVGGAGNDAFGGGADDDILVGDDGDDTLWGEDGNDQANGGAGNDTILGGNGNDTLGGGTGNDTIVGEAGNDVLFGEAGDDHMNGGVGADILIGGDGNDELGGGADNDDINGGAGNDTIFGEDGNDTINGSTGNDILLGGAGSDNFAFTNNDGSDIIADFTHGTDHIWFYGATLHNFADVQSHATFNAATGATTISYTGGTLVLNGVPLSQLNAGDFIFT